MIIRTFMSQLASAWYIDPRWVERQSAAAEALGDAKVAALVADAQRRAAAKMEASVAQGEPEPLFGYSVSGRRAVMKVTGALMHEVGWLDQMCFNVTGYAQIAAAIDRANGDASVDQIVLDIDSPGGEVTGVAECAAAIRESAKPVIAYVRGTAASAAFWLASACSEVRASPTAEVGSLGAVFSFYEQELPDGIKHHQYVSALTPLKRMALDSDEMAASMQRRIDDLAAVFLAEVGEYRGIDGGAAAVAEQFGRGDVYIAATALTMGMVDRVSTSLTEPPEEQLEMGIKIETAVAARLTSHLGSERYAQLAGDGQDLTDEQVNALLAASADATEQAIESKAAAETATRAALADARAASASFESYRKQVAAEHERAVAVATAESKIDAAWAKAMAAGVPPAREARFRKDWSVMLGDDAAAAAEAKALHEAEFGPVDNPQGTVPLESETAGLEVPTTPSGDPLKAAVLAQVNRNKRSPINVIRGGVR